MPVSTEIRWENHRCCAVLIRRLRGIPCQCCIEGVILEGTLTLPFVQLSTVLCWQVPTKLGTICLPPYSSYYGWLFSVTICYSHFCLLHLLCPLMSPSGVFTARHRQCCSAKLLEVFLLRMYGGTSCFISRADGEVFAILSSPPFK